MTENSDKKIFELIDENEICREVMLQHPEIWDQLDWNEYNLKERLEKNPYRYQQYRMLWLAERNKLKKIEILMDEYIGNLYDRLKYEGDKKLTKTEIEKYYIPKDEKVKKFRKLHLTQQIRTEVYEHVANAFKQQGFELNAYVKAMEL